MGSLIPKSQTELIFYYPTGSGSSSEVSRSLLRNLLKHEKDLPFTKITIFCKKNHLLEVKKEYEKYNVITYIDISKISSNSIIHIPILPTILPNSKFLLYIYGCMIKKTGIILQYHGDVRTELKKSYKDIVSLVHILTYLFLPNILKSADSVIINSYYMNNIITNYRVKNGTVIPNAIDSYWLEPLKSNLNIENFMDKNNFNIFYHGRLSWEKGVDMLIEALGVCIKNNKNIMLYLAGDGSQRRYLEKLSLKLGVKENVVFLGNLEKEFLKYFLMNADLAIYPSRFDAFSLSILEALACANCPVYFSIKAGISDFIIRDRYKLNYFDPSVENLIQILSNYPKNDIVFIQREFAQKYIWDSIISSYIGLYFKLLKSNID